MAIDISRLVRDLESRHSDGRQFTTVDRMIQLRRLAEAGGLRTLEPLLPLCLTLQGKPYDLKNHFPFSPVFNTARPKTLVLKTGRQVSKSTSVASDGILFNACVPYFRTLYITPLFEQIRRFSNNYVRPFIEQSPVRSLWTGTTTENSVLQRSFKNYSMMIFSFALMDADRVRGISADKISIDETYCGTTTYVNTHRGILQIKDLKVGDLVDSCQPGGKIVRKRVTGHSYHGYRQFWRLRFASGVSLVLTAESGIATDKGWKHVSEIIETYHAQHATRTNGTGDVARGWEYGVGCEVSGVSQQSRLVPTCVQPGQRPDIVGIYYQTSREEIESRLRQLVKCLPHGQLSGVSAYRRVVLPPASDGALRDHAKTVTRQTCDTCMAEPYGGDRPSGINRLVVHGRRGAAGQSAKSVDHLEHPGFSAGGGRAVGSLVDAFGVPIRCTSGDQQAAERDILHHQDPRGTVPVVVGRSGAIYCPVDAVQVASGAVRDADLRVLRADVRTARATVPQTGGTTRESVLSSTGVPECATCGTQHAVYHQTRCTRSEERETTDCILRQSNRESCTCARKRRELPQEKSVSRAGSQTAVPPETATATGRANLDMPTLWLPRSAGGPRYTSQVLSAVSRDCHERNQAAARGNQTYRDANENLSRVSDRIYGGEQSAGVLQCHLQESVGEPLTAGEISGAEVNVWDELVSIEDAGYRHGWDITVEDTGVFYPNGILSLNCQDMDPDHLPIIREVMSHSAYGLMQLTGTPKSLDGPLEGYWQNSSQAEWVIPCEHCRRWNIPSMDQHLLQMIGPVHDGISEQCPGTICYNCRKPIFPRRGRWLHRYEEKKALYAGYHVPQIIMPLHYSRPDKWGELLAKQSGWGNTTPAMFANEVLGESVDVGQKLISETELKSAARLPWKNNPNQPDARVFERLTAYDTRVMTVDWGGGGEDGVSFTTMAVLGRTTTGQIHCLWGKRLVASQDHMREALEIAHWFQVMRCDMLTHDYTGAGVLRETVLAQIGFDMNKVMPISYVRSASSSLVNPVPATVLHNRRHYRVDKTRSLLYTIQAIKVHLLQFFEYDNSSDSDRGLLVDFLSLIEQKTESRSAGDIYTITRNPMFPDDFAQAVNIGCVGIWYVTGQYPNYAEAASIARVSPRQFQAAGHSNYGWESNTAFGRQPGRM